MTQLKNNSYYKNLLANEEFKGQVDKIENDYNSIKVSVQTNQTGTLTIYHSIDGISWSHYDDVFSISSDSHKQTTLKGKYIYISYLNGATATTSFNLVSYLSKNIHNNIDVKLTSDDVITVQGLTFNEDGSLIVSGITGGGSGGDASAYNQLLQITEAETLNDKVIKCDTDNISGMVSVDNMVDVSSLATQSTLNDTLNEVSTIHDQITPLQYENSYSDILTQGASMGADTNPAFSYSTTQQAWSWQNSIIGGSNLYFYANTQSYQKQYLVSDVKNSYVLVKLGDLSASTSVPFLVVYSRPTGLGDHVPGFYRSSWAYTVPSSTELSQIGQEMLLYWGELPSEKIHPNVRRVECTLAITRGPALMTETLQFLTVNTDSSAPVNTVKVNYSNVGFTTGSGLVHNIELGYGSQNKTKQVVDKIDNLNSTIGAGLFLQLDSSISGLQLKSTLNDGSADVNVVNLPAISGTVSVDNFPTLQGVTGTFWQETQPVSLATLPAISGEVSVSNFPTLQGVTGTFWQETQPVSLATLPAISGEVSVSNFPSLQGVTGTFWQETQPVSLATLPAISGEVSVSNMIDVSALATETTLNTLSTLVSNQSAFSRFQTEAPVSDGKLDTIISNMSLTSFNVNGLSTCNTNDVYISNFPSTQAVSLQGETISASVSGTISVDNLPTKQSVFVENTAEGFDINVAVPSGVNINNYPSTQTISGDVSISNFPTKQSVFVENTAEGFDINVNITNASLAITTASALDANITNNELNVLCYGSSNGNNHHKLKTDNQGVLETSVSNAVSVENATGTQLAVKNTDATAIITASRNASSTKVADNQPSVNGPVQIGASVDTNGYMYVNAYITAGTVTTGGSVHLEFSPDGIVWGRAFYSTFFSPGSNQTALINVSSPLPWRYVRLYADSPVQLATVNAYISMK